MTIKVTKTPFERAEPAGKEILKKAKQEKAKRTEWADKEIGQGAKEMATYFSARAKGRVSVVMDSDNYERIFGGKNA